MNLTRMTTWQRLRRYGRTVRKWLSAIPPFSRSKVDSTKYWQERYRSGLNSGSGSYGRLARFKADFLNRFVAEHGIRTVIEFGSGDGAQLELADYPSYVGVDISEKVVLDCRSKFAGNPAYRFFTTAEFDPSLKADLTLSLDVIYHLTGDEVFEEYMRSLFDASTRFVVVYSSDREEEIVAKHVRHHKFSDWVKEHRPGFRLVSTLANPYPYDPADPDTTFADFFVYEAVSERPR